MNTTDLEPHIGGQVVILEDGEEVGRGELLAVGVESWSREEIESEYGDGYESWTLHTPAREVPAWRSDYAPGLGMPVEYELVSGKRCLIRDDNHLHLAPEGAVYPTRGDHD